MAWHIFWYVSVYGVARAPFRNLIIESMPPSHKHLESNQSNKPARPFRVTVYMKAGCNSVDLILFCAS